MMKGKSEFHVMPNVHLGVKLLYWWDLGEGKLEAHTLPIVAWHIEVYWPEGASEASVWPTPITVESLPADWCLLMEDGKTCVFPELQTLDSIEEATRYQEEEDRRERERALERKKG